MASGGVKTSGAAVATNLSGTTPWRRRGKPQEAARRAAEDAKTRADDENDRKDVARANDEERHGHSVAAPQAIMSA